MLSNPIIIHQSEKATIEWFEKEKIIRKTFQGFIVGEEMRNAFNAGLNKLKSSKGCKWLSDNRFVKVYKQEDSEWINQVWFTEALKTGWRYWAVLEPADYYSQLSIKRFIKTFEEQGIILKVFTEMEEAMSWLTEVDKVV
jgi:hypothetical protein